MLTNFSARLAHRLASAKRKAPGLARLVPIDVRRAVLASLTYRPVLESADRVFLEQTLIPALLAQHPGAVLSVGVQKYTSHHPAVFARAGTQLWTLEIRAEYAKWGIARAPCRRRRVRAGAAFPTGTV